MNHCKVWKGPVWQLEAESCNSFLEQNSLVLHEESCQRQRLSEFLWFMHQPAPVWVLLTLDVQYQLTLRHISTNPKVICHLTLSHNRDPSNIGLPRKKPGGNILLSHGSYRQIHTDSEDENYMLHRLVSCRFVCDAIRASKAWIHQSIDKKKIPFWLINAPVKANRNQIIRQACM